MKSILTIAAAATLTVGLASGAMAASAKFSANYEVDKVTLVDIAITAASGSTDAIPMGEELLATIKAPRGKELLIGVSGVANLVTFTEAKGKNGAGTSTSIAEGVLDLAVRYAPSGTADICSVGQLAAPGEITFASRKQTLSVDVDLTLADLDDLDDVTADDLAIEGSVTVALGLDTTAAHHFNFVAIDLEESGNYDVVACFTGSGSVSVMSNDVDTLNTATSFVAIAHRMVTVQEVRAVKDSITPLPTN